MATRTMDLYQEQRMYYRNIMTINNEGVKLLYSGNIEEAISTLQDGIVLARNLLLFTRASLLCNATRNINSLYMNRHSAPCVRTPLSEMNGNSDSNIDNRGNTCINLGNNISHLSDCCSRLSSTCRIVDRQSQQYVLQQQNYEWLDVLCTVLASSSSTSSANSGRGYLQINPHTKSYTTQEPFDTMSTSAEILQCHMGTPLSGLKADNFYVHDRPFLFSEEYMEQRCCSFYFAKSGSSPQYDFTTLIDTKEIIRAITVLIVNFALAYHCQGKIYGRAKSYINAIEMYYSLWSITQSSYSVRGPVNNMNDRWYTTMQCVLLNNLVHLHNELENYFESKICITCLYDLIVWKSSQQGTSVNDAMENDEYSGDTSTEGSTTGRRNSSLNNENIIAITYERINRMSFLQQMDFDQIMANIIYYQTPDTARAA